MKQNEQIIVFGQIIFSLAIIVAPLNNNFSFIFRHLFWPL